MADTIAQIYKRDIQLTHAQILTLRASPVEIVAAPGADKQIIFESVFFIIDTRTAAYSNPSSGDVVFRWKVAVPGGANVAFNLVDKLTVSGLGQLFSAPFTEPSSLEQSGNNAAMEIFKAGAGELTDGSPNNSLSMRIYYKIVPYGPFTPLIGAQS